MPGERTRAQMARYTIHIKESQEPFLIILTHKGSLYSKVARQILETGSTPSNLKPASRKIKDREANGPWEESW